MSLGVAGHRIVQIMLRVSGWLGQSMAMGRRWVSTGVLDLSGFCQTPVPGESGTIGLALTSELTCPWAALLETSCRALLCQV